MIVAAAIVMAGAPVRAAEPVPVAAKMAAVANHLCFDAISGKTGWPSGPDLSVEHQLLAEAGLADGIDAATSKALIGSGLLNQAILATGTGADGTFIMALGGQSPTCRLFLMRVDDRSAVKAAIINAVATDGWKEAPGTSRPLVEKHMFVKRTPSGAPMLLNVLFPAQPVNGVSLSMTVAAIPPGVALPQGY